MNAGWLQMFLWRRVWQLYFAPVAHSGHPDPSSEVLPFARGAAKRCQITGGEGMSKSTDRMVAARRMTRNTKLSDTNWSR